VLLFGAGGIAACYPTQVEFHYASPDFPAGRDLFGDVLSNAHSRRIRVADRFDFSKTQKRVPDAHREWFFRQANGEPVIYNGLHSACINGGYYRAQSGTGSYPPMLSEKDRQILGTRGSELVDYEMVVLGQEQSTHAATTWRTTRVPGCSGRKLPNTTNPAISS
jgi:hypothetical protein